MENMKFFHDFKYLPENELFKLKAWKQFTIFADCFFFFESLVSIDDESKMIKSKKNKNKNNEELTKVKAKKIKKKKNIAQ